MLILRLDKTQYLSGSIRLFRGDAWELKGTVLIKIGKAETPVDISNLTLKAFLPGNIEATTVTKDVAEAGRFSLTVSEETSLTVAKLGQNQPLRLLVTENSGSSAPLAPKTILSIDEPLEIVDTDDLAP